MPRLGASWIATGHYARVQHTPLGTQLLKAADLTKDQSYFLHGVAAAALAKTLFPIGELRKSEVRRLAHAAGLPVYDKPDSTGICFIGERPFQEFLSRYLHVEPGPIENDVGSAVGEHRGLARDVERTCACGDAGTIRRLLQRRPLSRRRRHRATIQFTLGRGRPRNHL